MRKRNEKNSRVSPEYGRTTWATTFSRGINERLLQFYSPQSSEILSWLKNRCARAQLDTPLYAFFASLESYKRDTFTTGGQIETINNI